MRSFSCRFSVVALVGPFLFPMALAAQQPQEGQQGPAGSVEDLQSGAYCSDGEAGEPLAAVTWTTSLEYMDRQRLDVTVFTKGFDQDVYTTLWPLEGDQAFRPFGDVKLPERSDMVVLFLEARDVNVDRRDGSISIELGGLRSGLVYIWRVVTLGQDGWVPSEAVRSNVPTCLGGTW